MEVKTMIYKPYDVVEVPFPFIDSPKVKTRKAVVLTREEFNKNNSATTLAMITSATNSTWDKDTPVTDLNIAGLKKNCCVRLKLFTIQNDLIKNKVGTLSDQDKKELSLKLSQSLHII
jgi:mRNA interferase MazF